MREASFILPLTDNSGKDLSHVHEDIGLLLCSKFGGISITTSLGAWVDRNGMLYKEHGNRFTCAISPDQEYDFFTIAETYARKAGQLAVYLVSITGEVMIKDLT